MCTTLHNRSVHLHTAGVIPLTGVKSRSGCSVTLNQNLNLILCSVPLNIGFSWDVDEMMLMNSGREFNAN